MSITIKCYATLEPFQPASDIAFRPGLTVGQVAAGLGIPVDEVAIVFRNAETAALDTEVKDGDVLKLFPVIGGG